MNLASFIAKKYFFSKKKKSFINFLSIISMLGVGIGTMALVIVLSVFNGLEELNRLIFKAHDPDLQITAQTGKSFLIDKKLLEQIRKIEGVHYITEVIQDNALAKYGDAQMVVTLKGVDDTFEQFSPMKESLVEGKVVLKDSLSSYAFVGGGVYTMLNVVLGDILRPLEIWYPRNQKINTLNPESNINSVALGVSGVFSLEQQYDDYIYVPLSLVQQLTEYGDHRTAIEINLSDNKKLRSIQKEIQAIVGNSFSVKTRDEQNAALFRAIKVEKLFIFVALLFIIGIASFNIFFSLTMLVIDKQDDIKTLAALGADKSLVKKIFYHEGAIISFTGAIVGLVVGGLICWLQDTFGLVKMGMQSTIIDAYPIKMQFSDFLFTAIGIIIITLLASFFPAQRAGKMV